jgi:N-acetylglucosaminyldiphosphoundecaprenol N-acetyl-beta-D-mannosaminyltransferase
MLNSPTENPPALDWRRRWSLLLDKIERVQSHAQGQALLAELSNPRAPTVLAFANAHAMNSMAVSAPFFEAMRSADRVLRDGSGMATLFKLLRMEPGLNLNGTDLIPRLIRAFDGRGIALFGTREPFLGKAAQRVRQELAPHSQLIQANGFLDAGNYSLLATAHRPELIVLGMGMPRQEEVAAQLRAVLDFPCLIVCGGAIIDFLGGKTPRAPLWMRKTGIEWVFRLALEPRRLFQRYVIGNPLFLTRALRLASTDRR